MVLSVAEIRYCVAEDIRMEAADGLIDTYDGGAVDRWNALADDYNSRCGQFQYYGGDLETARRELAPFREEIRAEGRARFSGP
jgi:hypothetical protein